jgi:hypothetical protein
MAYGSTSYSTGYGTPQSQGSEGAAGANQQAQPDSTYNPQRAAMWKPPPSSTASQPQTNVANQLNYSQQAAPGSPVTATGQIAPAQTPQTPSAPGQPGQPQQQQGAQTQPAVTGPPLQAQPPDPFQAMGGGYWTGQQWVPKNHPLAQPSQSGQPSAPPGPGAQPNPAQYSPYGPYPGRPAGTTYTPDQLPTGQPNAPNQTQFQGYQQVDQSGIQNQQNQLLQQLLQNPVLSQQVVNQMKGGQRDSAISMMDQLQGRASQDAASRGTNLDGQLVQAQGDIGSNTIASLLDSYRNTDIQAALQNHQGSLAALGASENVLSGQVGRQGQQFGNYLAGQQAQSDENQRGFGNQMGLSEFALQRAGQQAALNQAGVASNLDAYKTDLGAFFDNQSNDTQRYGIDSNARTAANALGVDNRRLDLQDQQFNKGHQLDWASLLNNMYLGRAGLGLDYANLEQRGQQALQGSLGF